MSELKGGFAEPVIFDMPSDDTRGPSVEGGTERTTHPRRRHLLKGIGAGLVSTSLAGCTLFGPERQKFTAKPKGVPAETAIDLGYKTLDHLGLPIERRVRDDGEEVVVTIENHAIVYKSEHLPSRPPFPFAVLTTPSAEVGGTERNPFLARSFEELLAIEDTSDSESDGGDRTAGFIQPAGTNRVPSGFEASIASGGLDRTLALRQGVGLSPSSSGLLASDIVRPSNGRHYQQQSDTPGSGSGDDSDGDGPPIPPLVKLLGPEGLGLTEAEITGWGIPPRLMDETTRKILDRDVTSRTLSGVADEAGGEKRGVGIQQGKYPVQVVSAESETDIATVVVGERSTSAVTIHDPPPELMPIPKMDTEATHSIGKNLDEIDPEEEASKMPGRPDGPDIAISALAPSSVNANTDLVYEARVKNRGGAPAENVVIESRKEFPGGQLLPSTQARTTSTQGESRFAMNTNGIRAELGELKPGKTARVNEVIIPKHRPDIEPPQKFRNVFEATVSPPGADTTTSNNTHSVTTRILSTQEVLFGIVNDREGARLEGATIRIPRSSGDDLTATTSVAGTFRFEFPGNFHPESLVVIAKKEGYRATSKTVINSNTDNITLELERHEPSEQLGDWDPVTSPIEVTGSGGGVVGPFDVLEGPLMIEFELDADPAEGGEYPFSVDILVDNNLDGEYNQFRDGGEPVMATRLFLAFVEGGTSIPRTTEKTTFGGRVKLRVRDHEEVGGDWKLTITQDPEPLHSIRGAVYSESTTGNYERAEDVQVLAIDDRGKTYATTTDSDGDFQLHVYGFREYFLLLRKPGFRSVSTRLSAGEFLRLDNPRVESVQAGSFRLDRR